MESNAMKILFKLIMKNPSPQLTRDMQVINLIYPITKEELSVPVRNKGCNEARVCVWPLESLMKEVQEEALRGNFRQTANEDLSNSYFTCKMCAEDTKFAKRSYHDFYYDKKLDYLIRTAKIKYIESFKDQTDQKARSRILKNFKNSKLQIHKAGGVILEYKKKIMDGVKVTYRTVVFEDTLSHYSQQLVFNPKDYARNLSALKITQNLVQRRIGDSIDRGFQEVSSTYSKKYQEHLERNLCNMAIGSLDRHTEPMIKQQLYAAKIVANQSIQNRKNFQLYVFYPRYNLTQIYTFEEWEDIISSCSKDTMKICKMPNHRILLYTSDFTYIIKLEEAKKNLRKCQGASFKRTILIKSQNQKQVLNEENVQVQFLKQWECYHRCEEKYRKFDSIRPVIECPTLLTNPANNQQAFVFGGSIQGISNSFVYKAEINQKSGKWIRQSQLLECGSAHFQLIVQSNQIFLLVFQEIGKQKQPLYRLVLKELEVKQGQLLLKNSNDLNKQIKSRYLLPLRSKDKEYILVDLTNKQPMLYLDLVSRQIVQQTLKDDISKFIKQLYDIRNQKSNFYSYPVSSITQNQINYNILSYSIAKHTFKILYGCSDEWMISDLSQTLLHD